MKYKKGNDIYNESTCLQGTLTAFFAIYILSFFAFCVLLLNSKFEVSICDPGGGPCTGLIYTDQWSSIGWIATSLLACKVFIMMGYQFNLTFGRNRICSIIWLSIILVAWVLQFLSWMLLLSEFANCNLPNFPSNICSSRERCLVKQFYENAVANRCPNSPLGARSYELQLNQLQPNLDFQWLFGVSTAFVFGLELVFLIIIFVVWCGITRVGAPVKRE